jgi:hypothetical protein
MMLADVQVHRAMLDMTELTLRTLEEEGAGAITEERLTSGVSQLVKLQSFGDADTDQVIYALAAIIVSEDRRQIENAERLLIKQPT